MWRRLNFPNLDAVLAFVKPIAEKTFTFMYENLSKVGVNYEGQPPEAEYYGFFEGETLIGVLAHCWNGNLMIQALPNTKDILNEFDTSLLTRPIGLIFSSCAIESLITQLPGSFGSRREFVFSLDLPSFLWSAPTTDCRLAEEKDLDALALMRAQFEAEGLFMTLNDELIKRCRSNIAKAISSKALHVAVDKQDVPIAMSMIVGKIGDLAQIGSVYVRPEGRCKGLSKIIMAHTLKVLQAEKFSKCILFTQNPAAMRTYLGLGFSITGDLMLGYPMPL